MTYQTETDEELDARATALWEAEPAFADQAVLDRVTAYIVENDYVSPIEAMRASGIPMEELMAGEAPYFMWDLGENFIAACGRTIKGLRFLQAVALRHYLSPSQILVYITDGEAIPVDMPNATNASMNALLRKGEKGYKKPHLMFVTFRARLRPDTDRTCDWLDRDAD